MRTIAQQALNTVFMFNDMVELHRGGLFVSAENSVAFMAAMDLLEAAALAAGASPHPDKADEAEQAELRG